MGGGGGAVVLEHTLEDDSRHFDLLIERSGTRKHKRLVSFRCFEDPVTGAATQTVERMEDHRARYLRHEGEIGGGRGWVERVASGVVASLEEEDGSVRCVVDWGRGLVAMEMTRSHEEMWVFRRG